MPLYSRFVPLFSLALLPLSGAEDLGLRDAVALALETHPALAAARDHTAGARQMVTQAGLRPNPRLFLQSENSRAWGGTSFAYAREADTFAYVSQVVESTGKRQGRIETARAGIARSDAEAAVLRRQIASKVAVAYWTALGSERTRDLVREELTAMGRVVDYTRARVEEGAAAGADLLRIQLEQQRLEALYATAANDANQTHLQLFREIGTGDAPDVRLTENPEVRRIVDFPTLDEALKTRPDILLAQKTVEQADARLRLERANARPDVDLVLGYKRTNGFDTVLAGVQAPLALFNRNQGQIGSASADLSAARSLLRASENQARVEWNAARADYEARRTLAFETLSTMAGRAAELARVAEAAYREGGIDVLRLLDSQRARIDAQLQYNRALIEYQQSVVHFQTASGVNP